LTLYHSLSWEKERMRVDIFSRLSHPAPVIKKISRLGHCAQPRRSLSKHEVSLLNK